MLFSGKKMTENNFKERIIENLKKHPEGLTILGIADSTGINRLTVSKYILVMVSEDLIHQRKIGNAKLCYLKVRK
jgi:response regulator of citrate/malate metabolism